MQKNTRGSKEPKIRVPIPKSIIFTRSLFLGKERQPTESIFNQKEDENLIFLTYSTIG